MEQEQDAFAFFEKLALFFTQNGYFNVKQSRMQNYEILYAFAKKEQRNVDIVKELLIYDLYARENVKIFGGWKVLRWYRHTAVNR